MKMNPDKEKNFRADINALRAVAVLLVMLFHFQVPGWSGGFIGVDIFFVISGFLMTSIVVRGLQRGNFSYFSFIAARAVRIVPALVVMVVALIIVAGFFLPPIDLRAMSRFGFYALLFWSNKVFADESDYFSPISEQNPFLHTWSLSVEWQFYLLLPVIIWIVRSLFKQSWPLSSLILISLSSVAFCLWEPDQARRFFLLPARSWELAIGGFVYLFGSRKWIVSLTLPARNLIASVSLLVMAGSALWIDANMVWPWPYALLPVLGAAVFIAARSENNVLIGNTVLQRIGLWSYSVYLWHWPISVSFRLLHLNGNPWFSALGLALSFIAGWASYQWVEQPFRVSASARVRTGGMRALALALLTVLALGVVVKLDGLPQRKPELARELKSLAESESDWVYPRNCENWKVRDKFRLCQANEQDANSERWLVVGDSHAQHYFPYFKKLTGVNVDFLTSGGCVFLPGLNRPDFSCPSYMAEVERVVRSGGYKKIILSVWWPTYYSAANKLCFWEKDQCQGFATWETSGPAFDRLTSLLAGFIRNGTEVTIVLPEPASVHQLPREMARRQYLGLSLTEETNVKLSKLDIEIRGKLFEIAQQVGAHIVDPQAELCSDGVCKLVDESGSPILRDSNHFRASYVSEKLHYLDSISQAPKPH